MRPRVYLQRTKDGGFFTELDRRRRQLGDPISKTKRGIATVALQKAWRTGSDDQQGPFSPQTASACVWDCRRETRLSQRRDRAWRAPSSSQERHNRLEQMRSANRQRRALETLHGGTLVSSRAQLLSFMLIR